MKKHLLRSWMCFMILFLVLPHVTQASWNDSSKPGWEGKEPKKGWIQSKIQHMTLEEKIGQLFMIHVYGQTPADPNYEETNINQNRGVKNFEEAIEKYHIGGVIYFNWTDNIGTPIDFEQVQSLSNGLQDIAMDQRMPIPLMIATDQEGGVVARVTEPATVFPGNMAIGATRSAEYAQQSAEIMGMEQKILGINMDLAPDLDVNVNPENPVIGVRSYSENPDLVAELGSAQVTGFQSENVSATAKHFPGHGDTNVDSHYGLPIINHDLETLHEVDLKPFKAAIDAGIDSIMPAHIVVPALDDSGLPATLSKPILTDLLREEMGFEGVIITDSLGMSGANVVPPEEVPVEAFKAGADILLNPPNVPLAYDAMLEAVEEGEISEKRVDESVFRILEMKFKRGLFDDPSVSEESLQNIGLEENLALADQMTEDSITLVKNEDVLPLEADDEMFVTGPSIANPDLLADLLNNEGIGSRSMSTGTSPTSSEIENAVDQAEGADKVIVTAYTANTNEAQQQLVEDLQSTGKEVIVTSMRNPYDIMAFPDIEANVLTYGFEEISVEALAKVLTGEVNPSGELPVTIPELYEYGHGLSY
ncbi:glycoside hydrolase family 3 protein [Halobacillus sp. A5]|uniref:glycoside hydrolase family 3 protein n=1 Tax=Halobacillus sp. A5 TaxID=2880263 RepID=UPI0020A653F9|nr:glycoside hydrolase family 3 protein [Halobacillus sp. A5]MCP3026495.1 glycoside hydrolase family 3 protein [Halobacillus sp. A5]